MKRHTIDNGNEFDFGLSSDDYARYRDIYPAELYQALISMGIGRRGQQILDLGSGPAVLPMNLYATGAQITAADISAQQIAHGRRLAGERGMDGIAFRVCAAEDTGFPDNRFDAVTAVQCFHYFDAERAAAEIHRVLKQNGLFCKVFMDWLPYEDEVIAEMEALVKRYNPDWSGGGFRAYRYIPPDWATGRFTIESVCSFDVTLTFMKEAWIGRVKTCRGVGATLSQSAVADFEAEYRSLLEKYSEPLHLKHQIHIELYRSAKC